MVLAQRLLLLLKSIETTSNMNIYDLEYVRSGRIEV